MPNFRKTHDENRLKVCLFCLRRDSRRNKHKFVKIIPYGKLENIINKHFRYSALDKRLPNAVCDSCRQKLYRIKNGSLEIIALPNLKQFHQKQISSRGRPIPSNDICECKLCQIAGATLIQVDPENKSVILNRRKDRRKFQIKRKISFTFENIKIGIISHIFRNHSEAKDCSTVQKMLFCDFSR